MNVDDTNGRGGAPASPTPTETALMADFVDALAAGQTVTDFSKERNVKVSALLHHILMMPGVASACQIALHQHADAMDTKAAHQLRVGLEGSLKTAEGRVLLQLSKVMERQAQSKRDQAEELKAWLQEAHKHRPRGSWLTRARVAPWALPPHGDDGD
jgi:hypothetical protein